MNAVCRLGRDCLVLAQFGFEGSQMKTVFKQEMNQSTLRINRPVLLYHQCGQQSVGDQEQNNKQRKQTSLAFAPNGRTYGHIH